MGPHLHSSRTKLGYPLYAADFDPTNPNLLLVGGGGGHTSSGVPNKLSLVDVTRKQEIREIVSVELPPDGDAVSSLAVVSTGSSTDDDTSLTAWAGINSSLAEQKTGNNEHLRIFKMDLPPKQEIAARSEEKPVVLGKTSELASLSIFRAPASGVKNETYQRITRSLPSAKTASEKLVAIATGLAPENEVVVLDASNGSKPSERARIPLGKTEAFDLDFAPLNPNGRSESLIYCTEDKVYLQKLDGTAKPEEIFETQESAAGFPSTKRPKLRSLRFLTSQHIVLLQNRPGRSGADLLILKLLSDGQRGGITLQKRLNKTTKVAVGLDVCPLSNNEAGDRQFVLAVSGQNSSIELLTLDYAGGTIKKFNSYGLLNEVHSGPITKISFSHFHSPPLPISKETRPQHIKLASVGVDQTVVIHTLPLRPYPPQYDDKPRYVLNPPGSSETLQTTFSVFIALVVVGIAAFLMQAFSEIRGAVPPLLGAPDWLNPRVSSMIARPYIFASPLPSEQIPSVVSTVTEYVRSIISTDLESLPSASAIPGKLVDIIRNEQVAAVDGMAQRAIVMRDGASEVIAELHHVPDAVAAEAVKRWDDLTDHEKEGWKDRLSEAGHWSRHQGEGVLKGIFFGELAGMVGQVVGGV